MSVSFYASQTPLIGWNITCYCGGSLFENDEMFGTYEEMGDWLSSHRSSPAPLSSCQEGCDYFHDLFPESITSEPESDELNVSNGNVRPILEALGIAQHDSSFEDICVGSLPGEDFLGRVMLAQAVLPESAERPTIFSGGEGRATFVECGVPAGYVQEKLEILRGIAEFAAANGREILWG